jgi:microcystin-dependent protein
MEPYIGQIIAVAFPFVPQGWLACDGSMVPVSQFTTLYQLIGNTYGGDSNNFALPDLRGRVPINIGQGKDLSNYGLGQTAGSASVALDATQIGRHTHEFRVSSSLANLTVPTPTAPALAVELGVGAQTQVSLYGAANALVALHPNSVSATANGGNAGHENRQPYQAVTYIIAYAGLFPHQ